MKDMATKFEGSKYKLIYVFGIKDDLHEDCLKIGEATIGEDIENIFSLDSDSKILNKWARHRIDQYTKTAGIQYQLVYTETAVYKKDKTICSFSDHDVHKVLLRSGKKRKEFKGDTGKGKEWFITDLETVKRAIEAVKGGRTSLTSKEISEGQTPILFRPEQRDAIDKTKKKFKTGNQMLWNAKMRFGKTLSALQVVKEMEFRRTLILTHRPVVDDGWYEDFNKIFYDTKDYIYGSKSKGEVLANAINNEKKKIIYFASMQDLRGSETVGGKYDKNHIVFKTLWDLIIVDEAHEGTQTELGKAVMTELTKPETKVLRLSGTPFNLLDDFKEDEIYTWDYVMEQKAKAQWDEEHFGDPNPYSSLPKINIYTYDLGKLLTDYEDENIAFNFREFFRVDENDRFIHEKDILAFLNLLTKEDKDSLYPFANEKFRAIFNHTLWVLPGVKAAKALSQLLHKHEVFEAFDIVNVAGNGDENEENKDALNMVNEAIGNNPAETRTITLTCGRLTTGVTVKAWMGVLMLSGSYSTAASAYMQTIFRVQSPATTNGQVKEDCYVFDFAPDRTLQVLATVPRVSTKAGKTTESQKKALGEFLNFCPVISIEGSKMTEMNVTRMLQHLKRAYIEKVVRSGFENGYLYNDEMLLTLSPDDLDNFKDLEHTIGKTKAMGNVGSIDINSQGLTDEEYKEKERLEKLKKKDLTEEEKKRLEELRAKNKLKADAISILRGISIRMPLLIYGADIKNEDKELTIDNFVELVDDKSWEEFMPRGVTKDIFNNFKKYYDPEIFSAAGKRIRAMARAADRLSIEERIERIADIFSTFRNPDKETVLTPWRVVNMHMGDTLGGYCFFEEGYNEIIEEPRYIDKGNITNEVFSPDSYLLEINSKSGLYPLYLTYNIYRRRLKELTYSPNTLEEHLKLWDETVEKNIFVICKTPMAKSITRRTLVGLRDNKDVKVNTRYFEDLINQIKNKPNNFLAKVVQGKKYWNANDNNNMKFSAVVGNPPYQEMDGGAQASATPVYNHFVNIAKKIKPSYISMIMPARWYSGGRGLDDFREDMLSDKRIAMIHDFVNGREIFPNVEIKGGICYFVWYKEWNAECTIFSHCPCEGKDDEIIKSTRFLCEEGDDIFIRDPRLLSIKKKLSQHKYVPLSTLVSEMRPYGLRGDFFKDPNKYGLPSIRTTLQDNDITIWGLDEKQHRVKRYVSMDYPLPKKKGIETYKIFIPRNFGSGQLQDNVFTTIKASPNEICTETFVQISPFSTYEEMERCDKYLKTKFARITIGIRKQDQGAGRDVYRFVPVQDFTMTSDIDWGQSIVNIDKQLYKKYGLNKEEQEFIEKMIKPM